MSDRIVVGFGVGVMYTVALVLIGFIEGAGGHGSSFGLDVALAPFSLMRGPVIYTGILYWGIVGALVGADVSTRRRWVLRVMLCGHYVGVALIAIRLESNDELRYIAKVFRGMPLLVLVQTAIYVGGQAVALRRECMGASPGQRGP